MFGRILANTKKQIQRSGWAGWGSISVMTLTFLVAIIFGGLAYFSGLWIQSIESRSNIIVFFEVGIDQPIIQRLQEKWKNYDNVRTLNYTSEEEAFTWYSDYSERVQPILYSALNSISYTQGKLPSSIEIQLNSLDRLNDLTARITKDIEEELKSLEIIDTNSTDPNAPKKYKYSVNPEQPPIKLRVDSESLEKLREVLLSFRVGGIVIISILFVVIFFFTLMTVEFRLYNQMEEIGVMQLVGGSLFFIRSPYILEGGFYGMVGALLATFLVGSVLVWTFIFNPSIAISQFIFENFSQLPWPHVTGLGWAGIIACVAATGFVLGAFSTWSSIRRYIR